MPRYSDDQKDMVKRLVEFVDDESQLPLLYSVLRPAESTIEKWNEGEEEKENLLQRAWQWACDHLPKIGWFVLELLVAILIFKASAFGLKLWIVLLDEVDPEIARIPNNVIEVITGPWRFLLLIGFALGLLGAICAYAYSVRTPKEHRRSRLKGATLILSMVALVAMVVYFLVLFISILEGTHPIFLVFVAFFCVALICTYLCFIGRWLKPALHDGYKCLMDLITILALVITITVAAFTLLNGETFPDKIEFLQSVLG